MVTRRVDCGVTRGNFSGGVKIDMCLGPLVVNRLGSCHGCVIGDLRIGSVVAVYRNTRGVGEVWVEVAVGQVVDIGGHSVPIDIIIWFDAIIVAVVVIVEATIEGRGTLGSRIVARNTDGRVMVRLSQAMSHYIC